MTGKRIAIFGLGRSGLAVAKAALRLGAQPHVFDETSLQSLTKRDAYDEAMAENIPVALGWVGEFSDEPWDFIVTNPAVRRTHPKLLAAVDAGIEVISEVEFAFRISKAPIVAITGTNGKSTTTVMTWLCLKACGEDAVLCGNIFGSGYPEIPLTDAASNSTSEQILVAEISSFQLEWIHGFRPAVAGITNITPDHLDRYTGFEDYAATKERIFAYQTKTEFAVVNGQSALGGPPAVLREAKCGPPTILCFGGEGSEAWVDGMDLRIFERRVDGGSLPFPEPHNRLNACMASLLSFAILKYRAVRGGEDLTRVPDGIIEGLRSFRGLEHRMEWLGEKNGVRVVNNSMCTNPGAVVSSAESIDARTHLLIGGVNKGLDFAPLAVYLANHRNKPYLFGSDAASLDNMLGGGYSLFATLDQAFLAATLEAQPGEVIMLSPGCASTDQFRDFRDRGNVFKAMAKEWLKS